MTAASDKKDDTAKLAGFTFLMIASVGWGLNFPMMKIILKEWPPLVSRGFSGVVGAIGLALLALLLRRSLKVPCELWPRLIGISILSLASWAAFMGLAMVWLDGTEAAIVSATMPVWVSMLAFLILRERLTLLRVIAMATGIAGLLILFGGGGLKAGADKWPGWAFALTGAICVALGTVLTKHLPIRLPPITLAAWQTGIGCLAVAIAGLVLEGQPSTMSPIGWAAMAYMTFVQFCLCYVCWFAAIERLPATTASIGTLMAPVVGVLSSAIVLGEPLGVREFTALALTLGGVALAVRS